MRSDLYTYRVLIIAQKQLHFSVLNTSSKHSQTVRVEKCNHICPFIITILQFGKEGVEVRVQGEECWSRHLFLFLPPVPSILPFFLLLFLSLSSQPFLILTVFSHNMLISLSVCSFSFFFFTTCRFFSFSLFIIFSSSFSF